MHCKRAFLLLSIALLVGSVASAQTPPQNLHLVGDHWTPWDPPSEFPEGAEVYTMVVGDTLWDVAQRFLGDPYLWPQIWERNQYILDAHWIYPGDPLLIGISVKTPEEAGIYTEIREPEPEVPEPAPLSPYPFVQLGHADDIYCSGFIGGLDEEFPHHVAGSEYESLGPSFDLSRRGRVQAKFGVVDTIKYGLNLGDIVYLEEGHGSGLSVGDIFTSVARGVVVRHPVTRKRLGRFYSYLGQVRLLSVQDTSAIGEIIQSCHFIAVGAELKPFVAEPVPSRRKKPMRPASYPENREQLAGAAVIVHAKDGLVVIGKDHVVFIDQGGELGLESGDLLTVYRIPPGSTNPPVVLGELAVLSVQPGSAAAKVIESRHPIYVGDLAQLN